MHSAEPASDVMDYGGGCLANEKAEHTVYIDIHRWLAQENQKHKAYVARLSTAESKSAAFLVSR